MNRNEIDQANHEADLETALAQQATGECIRLDVDSILKEELELAKKDDPALIVRAAFDVIEDFIKQGMSLKRIASALQRHEYKVTKGHLVRHLGLAREERGLEPLKRGRKAGLRPVFAASTQSVASPGAKSELNKPQTMVEHVNRQKNKKDEAISISATVSDLPAEIEQLKFVEFRGVKVDVTKINFDDYQVETKKRERSESKEIPSEELKKLLLEEGMFRGKYQSALQKFSDAVHEWDRKKNVGV